jgi:hypothetical protein
MIADIFDLTNSLVKLFSETSTKAATEKEGYVEKLEQASGDDVFKYILLINISALEGYVAQTRIQAAQSFRLSQIVAIIGFLILAVGIGIGIYLSLNEKPSLDIAYLASSAGVLTEFIASIFFYLYNKSLQQINRFHDRLVAMQQTSMSFLASSLVVDDNKRDDAKIELSKSVMMQAGENQTNDS